MPVQPTYPGVYIEEVPSGVRTITGVATSITAFIGRALKGPTDEPITITSFGDFERLFGGLWVDSTMSYAVRDFYLNGGAQAIIVRIHNGADAASISLLTATTPLLLNANSRGAWGMGISVAVDHNTQDPTANPVVPSPTKFNLRIYVNGGLIEQFLNVSLVPTDTRYLVRVLRQSSSLVIVDEAAIPAGRPNVAAIPVPATAASGDDGAPLLTAQYQGAAVNQTGINALEKTDLFNLLCIPPPTRGNNTPPAVYTDALAICVRKRAVLLVDAPNSWGAAISPTATTNAIAGLNMLGISGTNARNAALYFPLVNQADALREGQIDTFVPCGIIAGILSKTDTMRGVWKSPAGIDAALGGVQSLQVNLSDLENGQLNPLGINCLRSFPVTGRVVWGARTMRGADQLADDYKYLAVRRTALFLEESLYRGTQWVVFEPNDEPLWAQIRLNIGAFMHNLFRQGAFQGTTPKDAYLVKCDKETTTQNDINLGIVNIVVGFAPLKPAEFVILKIQQLVGQIEG